MLTLHTAPRRADATGLFTDDEYARRRAFFTTRVTPTPLVRLPALGTRLGLGSVWVKDETARFGLPAFKSLGVEFAVDGLRTRGELDGVTTLVCASAGNHGRAVARAARTLLIANSRRSSLASAAGSRPLRVATRSTWP